VIRRRTELGSTELPSMAALQKCTNVISRKFQWSPEREQQEINSVIQTYPFKQLETQAA